jgi:hypothetical protein
MDINKNQNSIKANPSDNPKFQKWLIWIEKIHKDTESMLVNREIHKQYLEIVKGNKEIQSPPDFHEWTIRNYGSYIVMAIRRQLDNDNDVVSLKRLLTELKKSPQLLTKQWFRTLYSNPVNNMPIPMEAFADGDFETHAGKKEYFDPLIAETDLLKLETLSKAITHYANKQIAHRTNIKVTLTFSEINNFIEELEAIVKKYILLFTGSGYTSLVPVYQYDWELIFTKVWMKPNTFNED